MLTLINGRAYKKHEMLDAGVPILRIQNLNGGNNWFYSDLDLQDDKYAKKGDLLYAWSATFGPYWCRWDKVIFHYHIWNVEPAPGVSKKFAYYELLRITQDIRAAAHGVAMPHMTKEGMEGWEIILPPLAEQTRIAAKLDELLAQVDTLKARIDGIPALLKRFRQSVLAAAVSGRLTEEWREFTTTESKANTAQLGELITEMRNGLSAKPNEDGKGLPILRISSVRAGSVDQADIRFLECNAADKERYALRVGDLLFTRYNGSLELVGVCGLVRQLTHVALVYPDKLIRVRCKTDVVLPEYLEIFFAETSARQRVMDLVKSTSGQKGISGQDLKALCVTYPSLSEQTEIVRRVEQLFAFADQLEVRVVAAKSRIDHLTQSILAKAFRGELVPQDPNDEPASVLLERIKAQRAAAPKARRGRKASV
ncbi:restriction endonuclease subunit S [Pseudomonas jilinensis]|uniref:restriction endonuclease subunit S n=1 Tax=Pseudomonas jilinensis TaxID=2078689 RepID=UPI0019807E58